MNVVYTFDDGYSVITATSMVSLFENNKCVQELNVYIVDCGISETNKLRFIDLCKKYKRNLYFVNGKNFEKKIPIKLNCLNWSFVCYVRLFFCELFPKLERILHIDCDTLVRNRLTEVYDINMYNNLCAACYDCLPSIKYAAGFEKDDVYFSNGFLLFNLDKMRKERIQEKFIQYIIDKKGNFPHLDQDVLNAVLKGRILKLHPKFNVMTYTLAFNELSCEFFENEPYYTKKEISDALADPYLIHFVGYKFISKPWAQPCYHPFNKEWIKYYKKIAFEDNGNTIKFKKKKYGIIREIIVYLWNICHKIKFINKYIFYFEKYNVRKKINKYIEKQV